MSLFGTLQIASNALAAQQLGLQVVGNNVANANTPGYVREQLSLVPAPTQQIGGVLAGLGVQVDGIHEVVDSFLDERTRGASADLANSQTQDTTYTQLESQLNELSSADLSSVIGQFYNSINNVLNQPNDLSVRNLTIQQGQTLAKDITSLAANVEQMKTQLNQGVAQSAIEINSLTATIADLNTKIATTTGGGTLHSDAAGLLDQRSATLNKLAQLIGIKTFQHSDGTVSVYAGGDYLVSEGQSRKVTVAYNQGDGMDKAQLRIADSNSPLEISSGQIAGMINSRDQILGGFLNNLNTFTRTMEFEFNKVYSSGQGLSGYSSTTSEFAVTNADAPLDAANLPFTPVNGSFQLLVHNTQTNTTTTTNIPINLDGFGNSDTTLNSLAASLNKVAGISATVTPDNKLKIASNSQNLQFAFSNDNSGVLASLGLNTFFSGSTSLDLGVNATLLTDPSKFAASTGGIGADTNSAVTLAALNTTPLDSQNGQSLANLHDTFIGNTAQAAASAHSQLAGYQSFYSTLQGQQMAVSGVSIDEETVQMMSYQRAYQASAQLVKTLGTLFDTLVNL